LWHNVTVVVGGKKELRPKGPQEILAKSTPGQLNVDAFGGEIAQSVEQRTENPCVAGSIPALATKSLS
jgi:hypothetical protein